MNQIKLILLLFGMLFPSFSEAGLASSESGMYVRYKSIGSSGDPFDISNLQRANYLFDKGFELFNQGDLENALNIFDEA